MKTLKNLVFACSAALAVGAFADAGNTLITFSTQHDTYADGSTVKDGEWYALCWSPNKTFAGINADFTATGAANNEKILLAAPLAEGGRCPTTVFQVDSSVAPEDGYWFVYLVDTRTADGTLAAADPATKLPVATSALNVALDSTKKEGARSITLATGSTTTAKDFKETGVPENVGNPTIDKFAINNVTGKAEIKVGGMSPALQYDIVAGATVDSISTLNEAPFQGKDTSVTVFVDKELGNFFKVVRRPLKKAE